MAAVTQAQQPLAMPTMAMPIDQEGNAIISQPWWRFLYGLYTRSAASIAYLTSTGLTATGATQATALALTAEWNEITSTPVNTGARITAFGIGLNSLVFNFGGLNLNIYPPVGSQIDALGVNAPYVLSNGVQRNFYQLTATQFRSTP